MFTIRFHPHHHARQFSIERAAALVTTFCWPRRRSAAPATDAAAGNDALSPHHLLLVSRRPLTTRITKTSVISFPLFVETETAAVAPSGPGLRRPLSNQAPVARPTPKPRAGSAAKNPASALRCRRLRPPEPRLCCASAATKDVYGAGGAGADAEGVRRKRLAVFVSGGGSNFRAIHDAGLSWVVRGDVVALVTDKPGCGGAEHARSNGIPVVVFPSSKSAPEEISVPELLSTLRELEVDIVLLAGYMKLIPAELISEYPRSILNIHPSLLPAFGGKGYYGLRVHKAVIASGARYSGPTVHFVDDHYDTGRILAQRVVPVLANDTPELLASRVLREEHQIYVEAVAALCDDRIVWRQGGVPLIRSRTNPNEYT